jgi:hypothetical protein
MEVKDLIGKEVIWKGNKCQVLNTSVHENGSNLLQLEAEETEKTNATPWVDIDEVRIDVYFTARPRLFGTMVDAYDGVGKVEWKDADGLLVPFRKDPKTGFLMLDKENRPIMTMKVFDVRLDEISLY